jgi:glycosyltransferase involved in cell wall biosynthesis
MQINTLTTSVVIPVYNEADGLQACLSAIAKVKDQLLEVIVVDNNSTDDSAAVAASFDFVKLVREPKQGVVHARSCGFNEARGDIIARIDADTILKPDWIEQITQLFSKDSELAAVSGSADYYDFLFIGIANAIDRATRRFIAWRMKRYVFLQGANMAIRNQAWRAVRDDLCEERGIHEDMDLAIHLQAAGHKVVYDQTMIAGMSSRRLGSGFKKFVNYTLISPKTYSWHGLRCQRYMYPVIFFLWAIYFPAHVVYRCYDPDTQVFSLRYLFDGRFKEARIDPTINVA